MEMAIWASIGASAVVGAATIVLAWATIKLGRHTDRLVQVEGQRNRAEFLEARWRTARVVLGQGLDIFGTKLQAGRVPPDAPDFHRFAVCVATNKAIVKHINPILEYLDRVETGEKLDLKEVEDAKLHLHKLQEIVSPLIPKWRSDLGDQLAKMSKFVQ